MFLKDEKSNNEIVEPRLQCPETSSTDTGQLSNTDFPGLRKLSFL